MLRGALRDASDATTATAAPSRLHFLFCSQRIVLSATLASGCVFRGRSLRKQARPIRMAKSNNNGVSRQYECMNGMYGMSVCAPPPTVLQR